MIATHSSWSCVDEDVSNDLMKASQYKAAAARRQVLADTLKCCVVSDFVPNPDNSEALYEFIHEVDSIRGSTCILSRSGESFAPGKRVSVRREMPDAQCAPGEIDLALGRYIDAFNVEEALSELHVLENGSVNSSDWVKVSRTLPWFDEFVETIELGSVASFGRVRRIVQSKFVALKSLYTRIAQYASILKSSDRSFSILSSNFPRGILGFRCLQNSRDPISLKYILIKQTESTNRAHLLGPTKQPVLEEEVVFEQPQQPQSKNAPIPDLKCAWNTIRVGFVDRNRIIPNMAKCEADGMNSMTGWTIGECRQFMEKIAVHGKNFKKIALNIPEKNEKDCVDFYYRFKVHLDFKAVIAAGNVSRQERRKGGDDATSSLTCKGLIDSIIGKKLDGFSNLNNFSLEKLNQRQTPPIVIVPSAPPTPTNSSSELRNALIDVIAELIGRGFPVPQELGIAEYVLAPRVSLSVVKTEISVLLPATRVLQSHYTV